MVRVIERAIGVIPGCRPAGTNKGMVGETIKPLSDVDQWLKQMAIDINKMREMRGAKPLICKWAGNGHANSNKRVPNMLSVE